MIQGYQLGAQFGQSNVYLGNEVGNPDMKPSVYSKDPPETTQAVVLSDCELDVVELERRSKEGNDGYGQFEERYYHLEESQPLIAKLEKKRGKVKVLNMMNGLSRKEYPNPLSFYRNHRCVGLSSPQPTYTKALQYQSFGTIQGVARTDIWFKEKMYAVIDPVFNYGTNEEGWKLILAQNAWYPFIGEGMSRREMGQPLHQVRWSVVSETALREVFPRTISITAKDLKDIDDKKMDKIKDIKMSAETVYEGLRPFLEIAVMRAREDKGLVYSSKMFEDVMEAAAADDISNEIFTYFGELSGFKNTNDCLFVLNKMLVGCKLATARLHFWDKYYLGTNMKNSPKGSRFTLMIKVD